MSVSMASVDMVVRVRSMVIEWYGLRLSEDGGV